MTQDFSYSDSHGNRTSVTGLDDIDSMLKAFTPNRKERSQMVEAGAPFAEKALKDHTPKRQHIYPSQDTLFGQKRKQRHIKGGISHKPNQFKDGSTNIGFYGQSSPIARWVNDGTYRQPGLFFINKTVDDMKKSGAFKAEIEAFKQIVRAKGFKLK